MSVSPPMPASLPVSSPASVSAVRTLDLEIAGLALLREGLSGGLGERFAEAVRLVVAARGRVHVTGMGKSGHIARKVAATLTSTGTPAHFLHPTEAAHGDLGGLRGEDDVLLAISWSGDSAELLPMIEYARETRVPLIAMTAHARSVLGLGATVTLELPMALEACPDNLAPTTSTMMQLALGDALALAVLEARGFAEGAYPAAFRALHPGGKLGARLMPAARLMHRGETMPLVRVGTRLAEAVMEMTGKGFGVTGVLSEAGALVGMVTDGDLRRAFARGGDAMGSRVEAVMTVNPWTVEPEARAGDVLTHMNASRITSAFVVAPGEERPVGILHLHDLLRIGL